MPVNYEALQGAIKRVRQQIARAVGEQCCVGPRFGGCGKQVNEADARYNERAEAEMDRWTVYLTSGLCAACQEAEEEAGWG